MRGVWLESQHSPIHMHPRNYAYVALATNHSWAAYLAEEQKVQYELRLDIALQVVNSSMQILLATDGGVHIDV